MTLTLQEAFDEFIFDKRAQGLSDDSIKSYTSILHVFISYMKSDTDISTITHKHIKQYSIDLRSRSLSTATISTYMRNTKILLCWIYDEYGLSFDPSKIKVPKSPKKKMHIYSDDEIRHIFASIRTSVPWITARNCAMVALMLDSGIRQCEIRGLQWRDVDKQRFVMKIHGKGDKERFVPVGKFALTFLDNYKSMCPYSSQYVFLVNTGKPITANAIKLFTYKLQKQLPFEFSSHRLRHNFATNYCLDSLEQRNTTGVYDLSVIMGHESIETTKRYEHLAHELIAVNACISHLDKMAEKLAI